MEQEKNQQGQTEHSAAKTTNFQTSKGGNETTETPKPRRMSRTMEAAYRLKGSLIVNDPAFLL